MDKQKAIDVMREGFARLSDKYKENLIWHAHAGTGILCREKAGAYFKDDCA